MNDFTRKYPNTAAGAIDCLAAISDLELERNSARPDPHVEGCWLVKDPLGPVAIVYLAGYRDAATGEIREFNDFEVVEG